MKKEKLENEFLKIAIKLGKGYFGENRCTVAPPPPPPRTDMRGPIPSHPQQDAVQSS